MQQASNHSLLTHTSAQRMWTGFTFCVLSIAVIWLGILPQIARIPALEQQIEQFEAAGINPGAMYYSELEVMPRFINELNARERTHPNLLWTLTFDSEAESDSD